VDGDWLSLVCEEVRDYLGGTFLDSAPIVPVSSRTGAGLEELRSALAELAVNVAEKEPEGPFRLPVDRVFTMTGFGTVVTGTLIAGEIAVGDEVEILPAGRVCRVRGIQTHGSKEEHAAAGQRVAVNLQGVEHSEVERGAVVVPRGVFCTTRAVDARLEYLPSSPGNLKHRANLRLHSATYEVPAQVILLDRDIIEPGESAFVQLRLKSPVLLLPGDPFVLRSYSPRATVGGGLVLDPASPRRRRRSETALELLHALDSGTDGDKARLLIAESLYTGISQDELLLRSGLPMKRMEAALTPLLSGGEAVLVLRDPRIILSRGAFDGLKEHLLKEIEGYLRENPMKEGIGKEELKGRLPRRSNPRFFGTILMALEKEGKALIDRDLVKLPGRGRLENADQSDLRAKISDMLLGGGIEPPMLRELCDALERGEKEILDHLGPMTREGVVVKIKNDLFYAREPLTSIREKLVARLKETGEITPGEFRELTGLSRKFMIPLLEYFDSEKVTIRVGDKRLFRKG
jgi:selenocysteine-specific elongation factor